MFWLGCACGRETSIDPLGVGADGKSNGAGSGEGISGIFALGADTQAAARLGDGRLVLSSKISQMASC